MLGRLANSVLCGPELFSDAEKLELSALPRAADQPVTPLTIGSTDCAEATVQPWQASVKNMKAPEPPVFTAACNVETSAASIGCPLTVATMTTSHPVTRDSGMAEPLVNSVVLVVMLAPVFVNAAIRSLTCESPLIAGPLLSVRISTRECTREHGQDAAVAR